MDTNRNHNLPSDSAMPPQASAVSSPTQRDRFELLSAYLDGEVTATERQQVEDWLAHDPATQKLHTRLLLLRQAFQDMPVPAPQQSVEQTVDKVLAKVERRAARRTYVWGGAAIAAGLVAAATAILTGGPGHAPQMAETQTPSVTTASRNSNPENEALLVSLDQPLVQMPKAAIAKGNKPAASNAMLKSSPQP